MIEPKFGPCHCIACVNTSTVHDQLIRSRFVCVNIHDNDLNRPTLTLLHASKSARPRTGCQHAGVSRVAYACIYDDPGTGGGTWGGGRRIAGEERRSEGKEQQVLQWAHVRG